MGTVPVVSHTWGQSPSWPTFWGTVPQLFGDRSGDTPRELRSQMGTVPNSATWRTVGFGDSQQPSRIAPLHLGKSNSLIAIEQGPSEFSFSLAMVRCFLNNRIHTLRSNDGDCPRGKSHMGTVPELGNILGDCPPIVWRSEWGQSP